MHHLRFKLLSLSVLVAAASGCSTPAPHPSAATSAPAKRFPSHWWAPVPKLGAPSWEVLPHEAKDGEVILSKRHELGILSNFAATPFVLDGERYASVEGFWQMMLYPESESDPRAITAKSKGLRYPHTRAEVAQMVAFEAKKAGSEAEKLMREMGIDWASYRGERFQYRSEVRGKHYELILRAMRAKLEQNPKVWEVLASTKNLVLKPDHHGEAGAPDEWKYNEIWMQLRSDRL
jgi:predicted NAD-dependent protein-ADP-ribosyltransferase YbiA (DUF1768 family)